MSMSTGSAGRTSVKSEPNVVPMIDIMLVLLIIFMIVTPLIAAGFRAELPKAKNLDRSPEKDDEVTLGIDENGKFFLNKRPISDAALEEQLRALYATRDDKILFFKADQRLKYGRVQAGIEIARKAGARVVRSITERNEAASLLGGKKKEGK
ncbi:MAG: ExbD/TolR family protein [Bacillota bacterium]|jgi:biopolymer transport protein ExbD